MTDKSSNGIGYVFRGGVDAYGSEPSMDSFKGADCEEVCKNVWDAYMTQYSSHFLIYAHCSTEELGNNESDASIFPINATWAAKTNSLNQFMTACTGILQ